MAYLSQGDAAMCSLVCHGWLYACRERLYSKVYFPTIILPETSRSFARRQGLLLGRTLRTSPHLQWFIRYLIVYPRRGHDEVTCTCTCTWIPNVLSLGRVRHFEAWPCENDESFQNIISSAPPLPSVKHVSLRGRIKEYRPMSMQRALEMFPNADSFVLDLRGMRELFPPPTQDHRIIRRISIIAYDIPAHLFVPYTSSLTRLDIEAVSTDEKLLAATIISMTHLVTLTINIPAKSTFLDHVVPQLPHLRVLYCAWGAYSSALLRELPGQIHTLWLQSCWVRGFDVAAINEMTQRSRAHKTSLRELCLDFRGGDGAQIHSVEASCTASGIHFDYNYSPSDPVVDRMDFSTRRTSNKQP